jgi:hypothetical protein
MSQDWLELDEGDPGFQLLTYEDIPAVIFTFIGSTYVIKFSTSLSWLLGLYFAALIRVIA